MLSNKEKRGFTLAELLVGVGIFSILMVGILTGIVEIYRYNRRAQLENTLNRDAFYVLNTLRTVVENGTVDYEEYYRVSKCDPGNYNSCFVLFTVGEDVVGEDEYGAYSKLFYDPGSDGALGALCNDLITPVSANPSCVIDKTTLDRNVGRNPYDTLIDENNSTAFCGPTSVSGCGTLEDFYMHDYLFVLSSDGKKKFFIINEPYTKDGNVENLVSLLTMDGTDTDGDGIMDDWAYSSGFNLGGSLSLVEEFNQTKVMTDVYQNFIPLHSLKSTITDIKFYISPLEDPYKAFAETSSIVQPRVTVFFTMQPSATELTDYLGPIPELSLQVTFVSQSYDEVKAPLN